MANPLKEDGLGEGFQERVVRAREEYHRARQRMQNTREALIAIDPKQVFLIEAASEVPGTAGAFGPPIKSDAVRLVVGNEMGRIQMWHRFLKDCEWYFRKRLEYEQLSTLADQQELMNPENRPHQTPAGPQYREDQKDWDDGGDLMDDINSILSYVSKEMVELIRGEYEMTTLGVPEFRPEHLPSLSMARRRARLALAYLAFLDATGSGSEVDIKDVLGECTGLFSRLTDDAEQKFWNDCSEENFAEWAEVAAAVQMMGETESYVDWSGGNSAEARSHTVKKGDTLRSIAAEHYDTECLWAAIYNENLKQIGPDPRKLTPGLVLRLP